jgi:hypothetical protein
MSDQSGEEIDLTGEIVTGKVVIPGIEMEVWEDHMAGRHHFKFVVTDEWMKRSERERLSRFLDLMGNLMAFVEEEHSR